MSAQSLLDASAVPNWLTGQAAPSQAGAPYGAPAPMAEGMSAQALIDERALPQWMRAEPETPAAQAQGGSVGQWLTSSATEERPPTWLDQVYAGAQVPQAPPPNAYNGFPPAPQGPAPGSVSVGQFVEDAALPGWLKAQGSATPGAPAPAGSAMGATGRVPAPSAGGWEQALNPTADEATRQFGQAPVGEQRQPPWMHNGQADMPGDGGAFSAAPRSGDLSAQELPPWLRDDQTARAGAGGLPGGPTQSHTGWQDQAGANQWDGQQWEQGNWEQQDYAGQQDGWNAPADPSGYQQYADYPNGYPDQGGYGGTDGYDQYDQYDQYGQPADQYGDPDQYAYDGGPYDSYGDPDGSASPPDQNARGGWRRIFRRK